MEAGHGHERPFPAFHHRGAQQAGVPPRNRLRYHPGFGNHGVACFRKLLHLKEIIFANNKNSIANDELHSNPQINRELSDRQQ